MLKEVDPEDELTDEQKAELDAASVITEADIKGAMARWREDASPEFRNLLDGKPVRRRN